MTNASFNRPGAMDLSGLKEKATAPAGASYRVDVTAANFNEVMQRSVQFPIVAEFTSARVPQGGQLTNDLDALASEYAGKFQHAVINIDTAPQVAQALGIQAVPMVVGIIGGQLAPLFQGVVPRVQIKAYLDELIKAAVANGIVGTVPGAAPSDPEGEEQRDARFGPADAALEAGDYNLAITEFEKLLATNPADEEAVQGRAGARLLNRTAEVDLDQTLAAANDPNADLAAQLSGADVEMINSQPAAAFSRLIALVRSHSGADRDQVRERLLELISTLEVGDPVALKARRELMTALF